MSNEDIEEKLSSHFTLEQLLDFKRQWNEAVRVLKDSGADLSKIYIAKENQDADS